MQVVTGELEGTVYRRTPRNEPMLVVEIATDRAGTFSFFENAVEAPYVRGRKATHTQRVVIYEHEWPQVQLLVRTDKHEAMLADAMGSAPQSVGDGETQSYGERKRALETTLAGAKERDRPKLEGLLSQVEDEIVREANRILCRKPGMRDGLPPLLSAKVVGKGPPPPTQANLLMNQNGALAEAFTAAFRQLMESQAPKGKRGE